MNSSFVTHLSKQDIIKNGSIFTPKFIVKKVKDLVSPYINQNCTVIDFGAGYGAFLEEFNQLDCFKLIATEIDNFSYQYLKQQFPNIDVRLENSLLNIYQKDYTDKVIVVIGNPPYNDTTSQYKKGEKGHEEVDQQVYARDLGISFLKMYCEINAKYICVLHPLSYLIKKANFNSLKQFKDKYKLLKAVIFSSKLFESINKTNIEFPVVIALYKKEDIGMTYEYISNFNFEILGSLKTFSINNFNTIDGIIDKYPTKDKLETDLQFYTIRDINALRRNKTFLTGKCSNGIKVTQENLYLYGWLDYFKINFNPNDYFLYGNLSPLLPSIYLDKKFKDEIEKYIINENNIVKDYAIQHNWNIVSKLNQDYDSDYLKSIISSLV